jgi:hypothetical protein
MKTMCLLILQKELFFATINFIMYLWKEAMEGHISFIPSSLPYYRAKLEGNARDGWGIILYYYESKPLLKTILHDSEMSTDGC